MSSVSRLKMCYLAWFSKPAGERTLYRSIRRNRVRSIVEMGVGMGVRSRRMLSVALRYRGDQTVRFTGIDLFEARGHENPGLTLKRAHRMLSREHVKVQVVPGDPFSALARVANSHTGTQMVVIGADQDEESLKRAWMYLPRMLTDDSLVFHETIDPKSRLPRFQVIPTDEINALAGAGSQSRRRAA